MRALTVKEQFEKHPERVLEIAIRDAPEEQAGKAMAKKLKFTAGPTTRTRAASRALALDPRAKAAAAK